MGLRSLEVRRLCDVYVQWHNINWASYCANVPFYGANLYAWEVGLLLTLVDISFVMMMSLSMLIIFDTLRNLLKSISICGFIKYFM